MNNKQLEHVRRRTSQINQEVLSTHPVPEEQDQSESARIGRALKAGKKLELKPAAKIAERASRYHGSSYKDDIPLTAVFVAPPVEKNAEAEKVAKARAAIADKLTKHREAFIDRCIDEEFSNSSDALEAYAREVAQFRKLT